MGKYYVENKTWYPICWQDGGWRSRDIEPGWFWTQDSDHDANVTIICKAYGGAEEWGRVWIPLGSVLVFYGKDNWELVGYEDRRSRRE